MGPTDPNYVKESKPKVSEPSAQTQGREPSHREDSLWKHQQKTKKEKQLPSRKNTHSHRKRKEKKRKTHQSHKY